MKRLAGERIEAEAAEKEREAELVRLKLVVAEAEKVSHLAALLIHDDHRLLVVPSITV